MDMWMDRQVHLQTDGGTDGQTLSDGTPNRSIGLPGTSSGVPAEEQRKSRTDICTEGWTGG
jgi:hypothetical protein